MRPRILIGAILHETNTFNHQPTTLADFEGRYLCLDPDSIRERLGGSATEIGGFMAAADDHGWQALPVVAAACGPSGPLRAIDWERLRASLVNTHDAIDGVLLALHGAMVTTDSVDPEGDLLCALRTKLGADIPIVVTLDMHANVSERMIAGADAFFPYESYPHVDHLACARYAADALARLLALPRSGRRRVRTAMVRPPMLDAADHGRTDPPGPMNELIAAARQLRGLSGVVAAGLTIGFPWADVVDAGPASLVSVIAESAIDPAPLAMRLALGLWNSRFETQLEFATPVEAMERSRCGRRGDAPLVLADFADNPAGGAYGDSPNLLRAMLDAELDNAAFATLADPVAVGEAWRMGLGSAGWFTLGGRSAPSIAPPLRVLARVEGLHPGRFYGSGPMLKDLPVDMGPMALLRVDGIHVVLASRALAVTDVALFHAFGLEPSRLTTIALKSRNHHRAAFGPLAREVLLVDAGGIATMNLDSLCYRNLPRPIWPLDVLPEETTFRTVEMPAHD